VFELQTVAVKCVDGSDTCIWSTISYPDSCFLQFFFSQVLGYRHHFLLAFHDWSHIILNVT